MKVFEMNDCDWWLAETPEQAAKDYAQYAGTMANEGNAPRQLTDVELAAMHYFPDGNHNGEPITFKEELDSRIRAGAKSEFFATTEF